jgi:hypothetical protein
VIFDDNTYYDSFEIDLMHAITELMLKTTFEVNSLNSLTFITEIESNKKKYNESKIQSFIEQTDQAESKTQTNQLKNQELEYLSTSSSFDFSTSDSSDLLNSTSSSEVTLDSDTSASSIRMIDLDIDTINILSEEVKRRRTRRQAYLIALTQNSDDQISSYHAAFSAFVSASFFYSTNQLSSSVKTAS